MENEKRLINESDLLKKQFLVDTVRGAGYVVAVEDIAEAPTVDAAPVVYGRWDKNGICTVCGYPIPTDSKYDFIDEDDCFFCYHCGAKMDGGDEDG